MLDQKLFTFLKVAQLKNYTKAAKELHLTQPAVTQQIKKLEDHYGCQLFDIKGKSVNLTPQGEALYHYAKFQVANENQLIDQLKKYETPIKIGATLSIADYYLPPYLSKYIKNYDELISVTVQNTQTIIDMLLNNELYCAFIEGIFDKSIFQYYQFNQTKFLPVARKGHPLEGLNLELSDIHKYPLILREKGSGTREIYENFLYQNNDTLASANKIYEINSFGILKNLLGNSDAISFMYEEVAREEVENGELCFLSINHYSIERPLYFIYPKNSLLKNRIERFYQRLMN
ncbi:LysR family transcriptional regulator [Amphibacillus xylanus]|uniref:Putative LysR family transcriptional regulator n=1 Tax=Amphibacillus xylanus (strain ATCC 51415 / DSM 6626 / JCM 7361 / LMG 17667 / NBRC 15112 / Ep01) TaxID=698758 RepID=K0J6I0_AMPXN|nr:LysR family transcriptional regulator [Amphibacillus xylanus]BAM46668.1 putative LysR family transcriptional regulator [Amphibacillus xylanus NBRC 15112]